MQLFGPRSDFHEILSQVQERADAEGVANDLVFRRYMLERKIGQCLMLGISLAAIATAVVGATHGWSDWLIAPIALIPFTLMIALGWLHPRTSLSFTR